MYILTEFLRKREKVKTFFSEFRNIYDKVSFSLKVKTGILSPPHPQAPFFNFKLNIWKAETCTGN